MSDLRCSPEILSCPRRYNNNVVQQTTPIDIPAIQNGHSNHVVEPTEFVCSALFTDCSYRCSSPGSFALHVDSVHLDVVAPVRINGNHVMSENLSEIRIPSASTSSVDQPINGSTSSLETQPNLMELQNGLAEPYAFLIDNAMDFEDRSPEKLGCEQCSFETFNFEELLEHFAKSHPRSGDDVTVNSKPSSSKSSRNRTNGKKEKQENEPPKISSSRTKKRRRVVNDPDSESDDAPYVQPVKKVTTDGAIGTVRDRLRPRNIENPVEIAEKENTRSQAEITRKLGKIVEEHRYSQNDCLTMIAAAVWSRMNRVHYSEDKQLKDGYLVLYNGRLQSLLEDSPTATGILFEIGENLKRMVESGREYQTSEEGLLQLIARAAANGKDKNPLLRLCTHCAFYGKDLGDSGWGCGYRNAQMLISSLLKWQATCERLKKEMVWTPAVLPPNYVVEPFADYVPNIPRLQELVHRAWDKGFGYFASKELDHNVKESSKWIGTMEIQALFSSLYIETLTKDFSNGNGDIKQQMFTFVNDYFAKDSQDKFVAPMYIQYSGHSRTIIGVDITGFDKTNKLDIKKHGFLILDPGESQTDIKLVKNPTRKWYKDHFLCPMESFNEDTYQILFFTGRILTPEGFIRMQKDGEGRALGSSVVGLCK